MADVTEHVATISASLQLTNDAREVGLSACRAAIRASASAIRAVHRCEPSVASALTAEATGHLRRAQAALAGHPSVAHAGFLHDAAKEVVEAVATAALVAGQPVPGPDALGVEGPAWLNGLAEAASELRRHSLDRAREGRLEVAQLLLARMDEVFDALVTIDAPDALTGGLRRTLDSLRAVIERTRADLTNATLQERLRVALEAHRS